mmetsp:Transcript_58/g.119  ORF Transcript_58/g.119 Transcript_58/m.119 type:complete len:977 (-) Transcript_58:226-3156(-)
MSRAMDEAGLLDSMTTEQLIVTCNRLQRSCGDMQMLLQEIEKDQASLRTEQDKLQRGIEKVTVQIDNSKKDRGTFLSLFDVDARPAPTISWPPEVQQIFRAKEEQKTAKRRRLTTGHASGDDIQLLEAGKCEESGPFSDASLQASWGRDISTQVIKRPPSKGPQLAELEEWVRTQVCGDSVAEAEVLQSDWARGPDTTTIRKLVGQSPSEIMGDLLAGNSIASPQKSNSFREKRVGSHDASEVMSEGESGGGGGYSRSDDESLMPLRSDRNRDAPAQPTFSRRMADVVSGSILWAATVAANATTADLSLSRDSRDQPSERSIAGQSGVGTERSVGTNAQADGGQQEASEVTLVVVLQRKGEQKWGLSWHQSGFRTRSERIVEKLVENSVAWCWNMDMEELGQPDKCIKPLDRLVSVNGKTNADEMRTELAQEEVRLEFIRFLQQQDAAQDRAHAQQWQPPAIARLPVTKAPQVTVVHVPPKDSDGRKVKFHDAFSAYMQACNPPGKEPFGVGENVDEQWRGTEASPLDIDVGLSNMQDFEEPLKPDAKEELSSKADGELGGDKTAEELEVPLAKTTPFGLVVQVLSLGSGTLRLSWRFDWTVAPLEFLEEPGFLRNFEVIRQRLGDEPEEVRTSCKQALLKLDIPTGFRYSFVVRAVIKDMAKKGGDVEWASEVSQQVTADFRGQSRPSGGNGVGAPSKADVVTTRVDGAQLLPGTAPLPRPARAVASGLGAFLQQGSRPLAAADLRPLDTSGVSDEVSASNAPMPDLGSETMERASSTSSPEKPPAVVMGPVVDPLTTAKPLVVGGGNLDPAAEKRSIAERLRLRRVGGVAALLEATANLERQRSFSMDSDDEGSLMRLSTALSTLEKTAASQSQRRTDAAGSVVDRDLSGSEEFANVPRSPNEKTSFRLTVKLSEDNASEIEFSDRDELPTAVQTFVKQHKMKELFAGPLLERAEAMLRSGTSEDSVDVVDLVE